MDDWVEWELGGAFRINIPADAATRLDDEGATAVIRLGVGDGVTEILMSNYPLKESPEDRTEFAKMLGVLASDFFARAVPKALGHEVAFNVEIAEDKDLTWAQGLSAIGSEGERLWIARIYARRGNGRFWLMHWNGPKENLEVIARIFVTFDPEESSFRSEG